MSRVVAQLGKLYMKAMLNTAPPIFQMLNPFNRSSGSQQKLKPGEPSDTQDDGPLLDCRPPPPTLPLPWDAFHETEPADKPL